MRTGHRSDRGFTLIELIIAATILAVIVAGIVAAGNLQGRAHATGARQRVAQAQGRAAMLFMERRLALAGFGIDPVLALDFGRYTTGPCPSQMSSCPRDSVSNADELVFYARNPAYWVPGEGNAAQPAGKAWNIVATSASSITITARQGDSFPAGQIVLAVCRGGNFYTMATVRQSVSPVSVPGSVELPVQDMDASNPFSRPDLTVTPATNYTCFSSGARLFLVDRYRFHIRPVVTGGTIVPYLMLDQGIDRNLDGTIDLNDEIVVAEGIENLQVAYAFANTSLATPVVGLGAPISFVAATSGALTGSSGSSNQITTTLFPGGTPTTDQSVYGPFSFYGYALGPPLSAQRLTDHQANVVAVRLAVVARSPGTDRVSAGDMFLPFNQTSLPAWITGQQVNGRDGFQRAQFESTVQLPNMTSTGLPYF